MRRWTILVCSDCGRKGDHYHVYDAHPATNSWKLGDPPRPRMVETKVVELKNHIRLDLYARVVEERDEALLRAERAEADRDAFRAVAEIREGLLGDAEALLGAERERMAERLERFNWDEAADLVRGS